MSREQDRARKREREKERKKNQKEELLSMRDLDKNLVRSKLTSTATTTPLYEQQLNVQRNGRGDGTMTS